MFLRIQMLETESPGTSDRGWTFRTYSYLGAIRSLVQGFEEEVWSFFSFYLLPCENTDFLPSKGCNVQGSTLTSERSTHQRPALCPVHPRCVHYLPAVKGVISTLRYYCKAYVQDLFFYLLITY